MSDEKKKPKLSHSELREIEFKVAAALNRLYDNSPFYYYFLQRVPKQFDMKLPHDAAIAMDPKTRRIRLVINPERTKGHGVNDFSELLQHESLHICYEHLIDQKYTKRATAMNFNKACDYILNHQISSVQQRYPNIRRNLGLARGELSDVINSKLGTKLTGDPTELEKAFDSMTKEDYEAMKPDLDKVIDKYKAIDPFTFACTKPAIDHLKEVKNLDFNETTSEELYNILYKKNKGDDGGEGDDKQKMKIKVTIGDPNDGHENLDGQGQEPVEVDEITAEEIKQAIKDAAQETLNTHKQFGNMPGELTKTLFEMLKSKTNYMQVIQAFTASVRDSDQIRTWTRRHRKYPNQTPGRKREFKPNMVMILDSSGSMWSDKITTLMAAEAKALKDVCENLTLIVGDTKEHLRIDLKDKEFNFKDFKLVGGGGTDLQFGWDAAQQLKADGVICHTDGYIPEFNDHGIKTMFFIYPSGHDVKPDKYKNFKIDECI